jgi:signal transduction histidine kinase
MNQDQTKRSSRRPWRLRTRLALALLGVVIPVSVLLVLSYLEDLNDRRDTRVESFQAISETVAASIDGFSRDLESFTLSTSITLGQVAGTVPFDQSTTGPYFQRLLDSYGILRYIFLTDLNGRVVVSNTGESDGFDLSSRSYIKALQSGRDSVWSGALAGSQTGQTTMAHGRVVRGLDGAPYYYLIVAFYPDQLATRLPGGLPDDANISLIDEDGIVMYSSLPMAEDRPSVSDSPIFQRARQGEKVQLKAETDPLLPDKRYGAYVPVRRNGWVVGFTRPASTIDGPLESRFRRDMAIVFTLLIGGYAIIVVITSRLSRPLAMLANTAAAIAQGERPAVPIRAADADVRTLQEAMDTMSRAIADREGRLEAQTRVLETLERVGQSLATELDFEHAVESVAQAALELTKSHAAVLYYYSPESDGASLTCLSVGTDRDEPSIPTPVTEDDPLLKATLRGETVNADDLRFVPGPARTRYLAGEDSATARSLLGTPIISREGRVQGALLLLHEQSHWYKENHVYLATGLARRGGVILENARLYSEAQAIQEELRRANTAKDEFIGVMSHELRTPITTIYGGARLLHARRRHLDESDVDEMVASIEEEAERLYRLVENLLALARLDLGEIIFSDPLAVGPTVEQAVKQFVSRHPSRPVELRVQDGLSPARGEATYVHQIIHNLVTNADKYSDQGLPIEVDVTQEDDELTVRVSDHGKGVPREDLDQIFDSFFRSQSTAREARGKGLGLTVCKRLVETMSGRIWARNRDEGGLEVGFTLPATPVPEAELEPAQSNVGS